MARRTSTGRTRAPPTLTTPRLVLRPLVTGDATAISTGAGDPRVARFLLHAPSPYPRELARDWIAFRVEWWRRGGGVTYAIASRAQPAALLGTASLRRVARDRRGELGYWLAVSAWGQGYASEAVRAIVDFGFSTFALARIYAQVLPGNPASMRVLDKLGMTVEGVQRQHIRKDGAQHDVVGYGLLASEWSAASSSVA